MGSLQISFTHSQKLCSSIFKLNVDLMSCIIFFTYFSSRIFLSPRQSEDNLGASDWECTTCCIDTHKTNTLKMYNIFSYLHISSNDLYTISFEASQYSYARNEKDPIKYIFYRIFPSNIALSNSPAKQLPFHFLRHIAL